MTPSPYPALGAVRPDDAKLQAECRTRLRGLFEGLADALAILGVDHLEEALIVQLVRRRELKQVSQLGCRPDPPGVEVQTPQTRPRRIHRQIHAFLAFPQRPLDAPPPPQIHGQLDGQSALQQRDEKRAEDPPSIPLPDRRLPERDHAAGWQATLADVPPLQLPPVVSRWLRPNHPRWKVRHRFATQDSNGGAGGLHAL